MEDVKPTRETITTNTVEKAYKEKTILIETQDKKIKITTCDMKDDIKELADKALVMFNSVKSTADTRYM